MRIEFVSFSLAPLLSILWSDGGQRRLAGASELGGTHFLDLCCGPVFLVSSFLQTTAPLCCLLQG